MAVMRSFCGCISTKTGTLVILVFYGLLYLGGIIMAALTISQLSGAMDSTMGLMQSCGMNTTGVNTTAIVAGNSTAPKANTTSLVTNSTMSPDSLSLLINWWCTLGFTLAVLAFYYGTYVAIGILVLRCILLLFTLMAIYAAAKDRACLMLPSIIGEFIMWLKYAAIIAGCIFIIAVIGGVDITTIIFLAVIGAFYLAFKLYMWLCLVGHYQTLREIAQMDQIDKIHILQDDPRFQHEYQGGGGGMSPPPNYDSATNPAILSELDDIPDMDAPLK